MSFHRTPLHTDLMTAIQAGLVSWLPRAGVYGAPAFRGSRIGDMDQLTAFFELRQEGLVVVADELVVLTDMGRQWLETWSVCR